jgi:hypothetical protein
MFFNRPLKDKRPIGPFIVREEDSSNTMGSSTVTFEFTVDNETVEYDESERSLQDVVTDDILDPMLPEQVDTDNIEFEETRIGDLTVIIDVSKNKPGTIADLRDMIEDIEQSGTDVFDVGIDRYVG